MRFWRILCVLISTLFTSLSSLNVLFQARVTRQQLKFITFDVDPRYRPIVKEGVMGIVVLQDDEPTKEAKVLISSPLPLLAYDLAFFFCSSSPRMCPSLARLRALRTSLNPLLLSSSSAELQILTMSLQFVLRLRRILLIYFSLRVLSYWGIRTQLNGHN